MMRHIDEAKAAGDSVGGLIKVTVEGVPVGLGSHVQWDRKLDAKIAQAVVSIQAFKGCEFGIGFEGGMSTGEPIVVRAVMKPIPTLYKPIGSVDIETKLPFDAQIERSDSCAVPAAAVVMENVIAWELATALLDKFGGDSFEEIQRNYENYLTQV